MTETLLKNLDPRIVIYTPTGRDAHLTAGLLAQNHILSMICNSMAEVGTAVNDMTRILLIAEEALADRELQTLSSIVAKQPVWSDLPILLLTRYGADSPTVASAMNTLGNVTLLERPVRPATLISSIRTAMKARIRQHEVGEMVAEQARNNVVLELIVKKREKAEAALREADRRKDEFLATLAHELRNPLAPILNSLHILQLSSVDNPSAQKVCEMMERQLGHLVRLVDDLMEVSRITRGKIDLQLEAVELFDVIRNSVDESRALIDSQQHSLSLSIPQESIFINGDPLRLSQIFTNLLNNAAKYMDRGGHIWITAKRTGHNVQVSVKDTGIGIPPEMLPHIFKMFTQVNRTSRQSQGGLGIGLTIVKTLTELHNGQIEVRSNGVGQGSEFIVTFPIVKTIASLPKKSETHASTLPYRRVLVVDDNRDAGESLSLLLSLLGVETRVVNSGEAALDVMDEFQPTVVILDIGMPGMDGYETARRIRMRPDCDDMLLIALTGWGQEEDRQKTRQAGFNHHLVKPADVSVLESLFTTIGDGKEIIPKVSAR